MSFDWACDGQWQRRPVNLPTLLVASVLVLLTPLAPLAHSASICRWVDDQGRTQLSDAVPDKYKQTAICTESKKDEGSTPYQQEADQRSAATPSPPTGGAQTPERPVSSSAKRPTERINEDTNCATRWRIYDESVECFGPYRTTRGATKTEAFEKCIDIPEPVCGPRRN